MTLTQFLIFWAHFNATHTCQVWYPTGQGFSNHVIYGGSCTQAFSLARLLRTVVSWVGASQGFYSFP